MNNEPKCPQCDHDSPMLLRQWKTVSEFACNGCRVVFAVFAYGEADVVQKELTP